MPKHKDQSLCDKELMKALRLSHGDIDDDLDRTFGHKLTQDAKTPHKDSPRKSNKA